MPDTVAAALARHRLALALAPVAGAGEAEGRKLTVMMLNVYLGGNIAGPIPAPTREQFEQKATRALADRRGHRLPGPGEAARA